MNEKAKRAAARAAQSGARAAEAPVQITRATIFIGAPFINPDDKSTWVPYTCAVEVNNRTAPGKAFSGSMPWPAGRTNAQRRTALQTIIQQDGPGQFPEGSTVSGSVEIDWIGV